LIKTFYGEFARVATRRLKYKIFRINFMRKILHQL